MHWLLLMFETLLSYLEKSYWNIFILQHNLCDSYQTFVKETILRIFNCFVRRGTNKNLKLNRNPQIQKMCKMCYFSKYITLQPVCGKRKKCISSKLYFLVFWYRCSKEKQLFEPRLTRNEILLSLYKNEIHRRNILSNKIKMSDAGNNQKHHLTWT